LWSRLLFDFPGRRGLVVLITNGLLQRILGLIKRQPPLLVFLPRFDGGERYGNVFLASSQKPAAANDKRRDLARLVQEDVVDIADLV
jgi:hypothetical protein